jgi:ABC-type polysaccharide/polyol phosphate transport system ATPase subunit
MDRPVVTFSHVSKRFRLGETHDTLRDLLAHGVRRLLGRTNPEGLSSFLALDNVNFAVTRGEAVGIIGPNGAGKSTVLKLLAGILRPDHGEVLVDGHLAALIEVGAGFHGDLTGRENVFLNGAILGMARKEVRQKLDAIVSFAGIERFLDMPVKRYSSGMYARLGFSIAAHVEPEVLLVDEVLSVGDAVFRLRCLERMRKLVQDGTTLVFVTHDLDQMQSICRRTIVLELGQVAYEGLTRDAVGQYMSAMSRAFANRPSDLCVDSNDRRESVELLNLRWLDDGNEEIIWLQPRQEARAELSLRLLRPIRSIVVELNMRAAAEEPLLSFNSGRDGRMIGGEAGVYRLTLTLPGIPLSGGQYFWNARIWDADNGATLLDTPYRFPMVVNDGGKATGRLCLDHHWALDGTEVKISTPQTQKEMVAAGVVCENLSIR